MQEHDEIFSAVTAITGVNRVFIKGPGRQPLVVHARAVTIRVMRLVGMSWHQIGDSINRSHSACVELDRDKRQDPRVADDALRVSETLKLRIVQAA